MANEDGADAANKDVDDTGKVASVPPEALEHLQGDSGDKVFVHAAEHRLELSRSPLPSPLIMREYRDVIPGLPEKLVEWTEAESLHRREMERADRAGGEALRRNGQRAAALTSIVGLLIACTL